MPQVVYPFFVILFIIAGCTHRTGPRSMRLSHTEESIQKVARAQSIYDAGDIDAALSQLKTLIDTTPYSAPHDQAYELLITWLLQIGKAAEAKRYASYFLHHHTKSRHCDTIISLFNRKKADVEHIPLFSVGIDNEETIVPEQSTDAISFEAEILSQN